MLKIDLDEEKPFTIASTTKKNEKIPILHYIKAELKRMRKLTILVTFKIAKSRRSSSISTNKD